ncbi:hypothetical protein FVB43_04760 [Erwinia rhapontici]|uniref:hypothetical protein n=1 Tax=Erwinia rhapontici TaxID=55212 RepID=UPI001438655C|nr:hypothetical protein [Erwinia rhapontici]NKG29350.1 hypothetical protein [Erwinia rhapontici]
MSTNTLEFANQLLAENERLKQIVVALESDAKLSTETLKNADAVVLAAKAKFDQVCADDAVLIEHVRAMAADGDTLLNERLRLLEKVEAQTLYIAALEVERKAFEKRTPDSITREIRAQGVDLFAAAEKGWADQWEKHGVNDGSVTRSRMVVQDAQKFAAAIRAGKV